MFVHVRYTAFLQFEMRSFVVSLVGTNGYQWRASLRETGHCPHLQCSLYGLLVRLLRSGRKDLIANPRPPIYAKMDDRSPTPALLGTAYHLLTLFLHLAAIGLVQHVAYQMLEDCP